MEFEELGSNCSLSYCGVKDFLPFKCKRCNGVFCLEHRAFEKHECKQTQGVKQKKAYKCPICLQVIKFDYDMSENEMQSIHQAMNCDPSNYQKKKKAEIRCVNDQCKIKLTQVNYYECKNCGQYTCLHHRMKDKHDCKKEYRYTKGVVNGKKKINLNQKYKPKPVVMNEGLGKQTFTQPQVKKKQKREVCSVCGLSFQTLSKLFEHASIHQAQPQHQNQSQHQNQPQHQQKQSQREACPICGLSFANIMKLIEHSSIHQNNQQKVQKEQQMSQQHQQPQRQQIQQKPQLPQNPRQHQQEEQKQNILPTNPFLVSYNQRHGNNNSQQQNQQYQQQQKPKPQQKPQQQPNKREACPTCGKSFNNIIQMIQHSEIHYKK